MAKFIKRRCNCGCNKVYIAFKTPPLPSEYKIVSYTLGDNPRPLAIRRELDGQLFRLGDTIKRVSPSGKKHNRAVIYDIQVEESGFMQLHAYSIPKNGTACIVNTVQDYISADNPNLFNYIENITNPI